MLWGTWWAVFPFAVYSILYASTSGSRWHESGHGTAFKTDWMNNALYEIASFMGCKNATRWRWSHARHHSDTIIVGRDVEIAVTRPPKLFSVFLTFSSETNRPAARSASGTAPARCGRAITRIISRTWPGSSRTSRSGLALSARPEDNWQSCTGFVPKVLRENYLAKHPDPTSIEYYFCGPPAMVQAALEMLDGLKVDRSQIAFDEF